MNKINRKKYNNLHTVLYILDKIIIYILVFYQYALVLKLLRAHLITNN